VKINVTKNINFLAKDHKNFKKRWPLFEAFYSPILDYQREAYKNKQNMKIPENRAIFTFGALYTMIWPQNL
jgi:hypothetical protein